MYRQGAGTYLEVGTMTNNEQPALTYSPREVMDAAARPELADHPAVLIGLDSASPRTLQSLVLAARKLDEQASS
jgi:hypothetical protein